MVELRAISYSYAGTPALVDIDLSVAAGTAVALIGPNGSGKSTLLRLLAGVITGESGSYRFDGEAITASRLRETGFSKRFHQRVGLLFQNSDVQLFCPVVYDEIAFGPRQMAFDEAQVDERVTDCMRLLRIEALSQRAPFHLSEGEKRKVALASVLALNPELLLLDEPMNGLDPRSKHLLRELLVSLREAGKSIVCATHDLEYVDGVFDSAVLFSEDHTIVRAGTYAEMVGDREFLRANNIL